MESNPKILLQNIQDAYSSLLNMTIFITDQEGNPITSMSGINSFIETFVYSSETPFLNLLKKIINQYSTFMNCVVVNPIDYHSYMGIKVFLMPIIVKGNIDGYIWCGAFIEEGFFEFVMNWVGSLEESEKWKGSIHHIPVISNIQLQEKKQHLEKMADVCAKILKPKINDKGLETLEKLVKTLNATNTPYNQLLEILKENRNIDFLGIATLVSDAIKIKSFIGPNATELSGISFDKSQTFFDITASSMTLKYWENIGFDPRLSFLMQRGVKSTAFFCYPILINNTVAAFVFGGKTHLTTISLATLRSVQIVGKLIELSMNNDSLKSSLDLHLMKLSMLMEISRAMSTFNNLKDILLMIVDIAHSLVPGHFTCINTTSGNYEFMNITNYLKDDFIEDYCKKVRTIYFQLEGKLSLKTPRIVENDETYILECPIHINGALYAILSVLLQRPSELKEAEAYLSSLASISVVALKAFIIESQKSNLNAPLTDSEMFRSTSILEQLTNRELDVLKLVVKGMSNKEIGDELYISSHTVKNHITNIFNKLGVTDRTQIIALIYQLNYGKFIMK